MLDDEEAANFSMLLLLAGHVTTTVLLGNAVRTFDENPGVWDELRADPALIPGAIEEVLRLRSPFVQVGRATVRAVEVGGVELPADALVLPWLLSANRDPAAHREPDRFDLRRGLGGGAAAGVRARRALLPRRPAGPAGGPGRAGGAHGSLPRPRRRPFRRGAALPARHPRHAGASGGRRPVKTAS